MALSSIIHAILVIGDQNEGQNRVNYSLLFYRYKLQACTSHEAIFTFEPLKIVLWAHAGDIPPSEGANLMLVRVFAWPADHSCY